MSILQHPMRITVATNSLVATDYESYTNHIQTWFRFGRTYRNIEFVMVNPARMSIDRMRNMAAQQAIESESKYLLFLDDDVLVQPDGLHRLIQSNVDVASGKVVIRGYPFDWMAFKYEKRNGAKQKGLYSQAELPEFGDEKVDAVGFSFTLIKVELLKALTPPWFVTGVNNTEDIYFCVKARQVNKKTSIVVNCDVHCGHILWPEVMAPHNRQVYKKYYEKVNPQILAEKALAEELRKNPRLDRSRGYLKEAKKLRVVK